jgi:hypothetical protein
MPKNATISTRSPQLLSIGTEGKIWIKPFSGPLLSRLIVEFEHRNTIGDWCGYAMLEKIPEKLRPLIDTIDKCEEKPVCSVMFLKGSSAHNYLFLTDEHGYILFNQDLNILHTGPSLCDALDKIQLSCYRN